MQTIKVEVAWSDKNYCGGWGSPEVGAVMASAKTLDKFKAEFQSALEFHIEGMLADDEPVPQWLIDKDYTIDFDLQISAILRESEKYTTMAAISRVTGINHKLLSHYANSLKIPRESQRNRIIDGIHALGQQLIAVR